MIVKKPPMGWNSWNTFGHDINEELIREIADVMVRDGYLDAGYEYLVVDDCWQEHERDENGRLVADRKKFPSGMKALGDYIHSKGLKFGIYSCAGTLTCEGFPGSFEHEFIDAQTFAEWGVDFLKYDRCYKPLTFDVVTLFRRMGMALANCGRDILFAACSWGADETRKWIKSTGAHMWRATNDIGDSHASIRQLAEKFDRDLKYSSPGSFADLDMLVVGMYGEGNVAFGGCTTAMYKTHFTYWAQLNSPLMIGADIRKIPKEARDILLNREVIAINQDEAFFAATPIFMNEKDGSMVHIYEKLLHDGSYAYAIFNLNQKGEHVRMTFEGDSLLRDVWAKEDMGVYGEILMPIPAHTVKIIKSGKKRRGIECIY